LVHFGGFNTCPPSRHPAAMEEAPFLDALANRIRAASDTTVRTVRSCFALSPKQVFFTVDSGRSTQNGTLDSLYDAVDQLVGEDDEVYVSGQSYGGWVAMTLLSRLPRLRVVALATIDPISMVACTPTIMTASVLMGRAAAGCTGAPPDLVEQFPEIRRRVGVWINRYELDSVFLHSSSIAEASSDKRQYYGSLSGPFAAHTATESDPAIWADISAAFVQRATGARLAAGY
jgi:pimeloyl-ACP methyl ester carboxylesterase